MKTLVSVCIVGEMASVHSQKKIINNKLHFTHLLLAVDHIAAIARTRNEVK